MVFVIPELLLGDPSGLHFPDGFLQVAGGHGVIPSRDLVGDHGPSGEDQGRDIQSCGAHQHAGDDFITRTQEHHPVEMMGPCHGFCRCRNHIPLGQDILHPQHLGHPVAGGRHSEFGRRPPCCPNPFFHILGQFLERFMARIHIVPGIHDADQRFVDILPPVPHRSHQSLIIRVRNLVIPSHSSLSYLFL